MNLRDKKLIKNDKLFETKDYIMDNLNNFILYNLNQNTFINAVDDRLNNE